MVVKENGCLFEQEFPDHFIGEFFQAFLISGWVDSLRTDDEINSSEGRRMVKWLTLSRHADGLRAHVTIGTTVVRVYGHGWI
jgi:hypothetical protein